jgi:hypothetical protein
MASTVGCTALFSKQYSRTIVGDVSYQETSVTIANLQPDHHYVIRIVTLNAANFQAPSVPIRMRTLSAESDQFYSTVPQTDVGEGGQDDEYTPTPIIRPNKNLVDAIVPPTATPAAMTREHSNSISRARRSEPGRRNSPASQTVDQARSAQEAADSLETIKQLTEKLNGLRRELDDMDRQIQDEEEEFYTQKVILVEKRDEKKAALKEKEDASRDLRKEVATLERANASAQTRKSQQEKLLRQKQAERKKVKDDIARWGHEAVELRVAAERLQQERKEYEDLSETRIKELRDKHAEEIQTNKSLEECIREKGTQVKALEEERKKLEESDEICDAQDGTENAYADEDRRWKETLGNLQQRYTEAWAYLNDAERLNQDTTAQLQYLQQRRMSQPQLMSGMAQEFVPQRRTSPRSRPLSMRDPLISMAPGGFVHSSAAPFNSTTTATSPPFQSGTPYFNPANGMALAPSSAHKTSFSQDLESLTGGGPMSPTAGSLLPSGLFGDDAGWTGSGDEDDPGPPLGPSPNLRHILPGLGAPGTLEQVQSPSSPISVQSRPPSTFASPRESVGQLGSYPSNENGLDSDRRSIASASSSFKNPQTRFGGLFGLNRQRGKTFSDQGPPLGSLKSSQSQSLPRQEHEDQDPVGSSRRRGSHSGGAWYNAFMPTKTQPAESASSPSHVATRKRGFNMFGAKTDPWLASTSGPERPSSPRQGSNNSLDSNALPRPSTESQTRFGWNVDSFNSRSSPLTVDWKLNHTNSSSWSRLPSRRPSIQHGSSGSLLNENLLQGDGPDFPSTTRSPTQAPIGTRPQSSASALPPTGPIPPTPPKQLNPAAPQFKSIFTREDKAERAKKAAEKAAGKEAKKAEKKEEKKTKGEKPSRRGKEVALPSDTVAHDDDGRDASSPVDPRASRDGRSISTADVSDASPRESLERSISQTTSESQPHGSFGSFGKESFMQKLSRKSSNSQFLQFGKGKSFLHPKRSSEVVTPDETDEDAGGFMARSVDSPGQSPSLGTPKDKSSALSWSSIKRMGKRGDKTPSLHDSIASEATGDEDDEYAESSKDVA